jgi:hypothetical protein
MCCECAYINMCDKRRIASGDNPEYLCVCEGQNYRDRISH